jgi:hypothetical protein
VSERNDKIVAAGHLEETLALAAKLHRLASPDSPGSAASPSDHEASARAEEANAIRLAMRRALEGYGCPGDRLEVLTLEIAEVYDACRAYLGKLQRLLSAEEPDSMSVAVTLASLEAGLADMRNHACDLERSLRQLVEFLAASGGDL